MTGVADVNFDRRGSERGLPFCPRCGNEFYTDDGTLFCPCVSVDPVPTARRLTFWGSDCGDCGNATPASMRCDSCASDEHTVVLWVRRQRRTLRCWLGWHDWVRRDDVWSCSRCPEMPAVCPNCGRQHDPTVILTVCTVTRGVKR